MANKYTPTQFYFGPAGHANKTFEVPAYVADALRQYQEMPPSDFNCTLLATPIKDMFLSELERRDRELKQTKDRRASVTNWFSDSYDLCIFASVISCVPFMFAPIGKALMVPEVIVNMLEPYKNMTQLEFKRFLTALDVKAMLCSIFGKDANGNWYASEDDLRLLTVLHAANVMTFPKPFYRQVKHVPKYINTAFRMIQGTGKRMLDPALEVAIHFSVIVENKGPFREPACSTAFSKVHLSVSEDEKKVTDSNGIVHSIEPLLRPLEIKIEKQQEIAVLRRILAEIPTDLVRISVATVTQDSQSTKLDKDGLVTFLLTNTNDLFTVNTTVKFDWFKLWSRATGGFKDDSAKATYLKLMVDIFGMDVQDLAKPFNDQSGESVVTFLYRYLDAIDSIMSTDMENNKYAKFYILNEDAYRTANSFHVLLVALLSGLVNPVALTNVKPGTTLVTVNQIIARIFNFIGGYADHMKGFDDGVKAVSMAPGSSEENELFDLYCWPTF